MPMKLDLTEEETYGLSVEETKLAKRWLREHHTAGVISDLESAKLFEIFLLGETLTKLANQFPQYPMGQIAFTAAYRQWFYSRDKMMFTVQDRVKAKVVKSVLDQVDFLTTMMAVANTEHLEAMMLYCKDPVNNPKPALRIGSIKEYQTISETLYKIVASATASSNEKKKDSPMMSALVTSFEPKKLAEKEEELSLTDLDGEES